ncbi:hypothetical protein DL769_005901 [Monosporascus sp. CRB-8-3]|nr:hypothetical protein DL769_005901 [Monosporascus sp. CRB-8-3]
MAWADQVQWLGPVSVAILTLATVRLLLARSPNTAQVRLWESLDAVGVGQRGSFFSWMRAIVGSLTSTAQRTREGYARFCKSQNRPFALPSLWTGRAVVVLPPSLLPLLNRPESELAAHRAQLDTIQLPYMMADPDVYDNPIHFDIVRRSMSRKDVGALAAVTAEELHAAFTAYWGLDADNWVKLNNWDACGRVMTRAAMRALVGVPLCRDERLLDWSRKYASAVIAGTAFINCLPPVLRPYIGPLFGMRAKHYQAHCLTIMEPVIKERIQMWEQSKGVMGEQDDFLQWTIMRCAKAGPEQMDPTRIAMRLLGLATMSVMGMVYVLAHCIPDLYGSRSTNDFVAGLEAECRNVAAAFPTTAASLASNEALHGLYRVDSTLRESMRLSNISVTSLARDVIVDDMDLGLAENLYKIPQGVRLVFPTQDIHRDESIYETPLDFDAFRFSRAFEGNEHKSDREAVASTTCSPSFLVFGYGRRACPGRWYAMQTLKQTLAYIVLHYDVELIGKPRERRALLNVMVPQQDLEIRIRRKPIST